jgi:1-acyl-sn-glycerol-3-phosphate acyltransferase
MSAPNNPVIRSLRLARLGSHLLVGLGLSAIAYPLIGARGRSACFRWWSRRLLVILNVRLRRHGAAVTPAPGNPTLVVANHVSWLDVFVIRSSLDCLFVAKSEIRGWPLVGWLVARQGTVFVHRARRRDTSRVNASLGRALQAGQVMAVFAEGTTTDGTEVRPFHGSLLQPLVETAGYAQPVAVRYTHPDGRISNAAAYAGDRSLWESTLLIVSQPVIHVDLHLLPAVHAVGRHRRDLAEQCAAQVAGALSLPAPGRARGTRGDPQAVTP